MSRYVIDKKLLDENIEIVKQKAGVPLIGVVKGNGYGFGIKEITKILVEHGIKTFAVTEVTDLPILREVLTDEDILVMRSTCIKDECRNCKVRCNSHNRFFAGRTSNERGCDRNGRHRQMPSQNRHGNGQIRFYAERN